MCLSAADLLQTRNVQSNSVGCQSADGPIQLLQMSVSSSACDQQKQPRVNMTSDNVDEEDTVEELVCLFLHVIFCHYEMPVWDAVIISF